MSGGHIFGEELHLLRHAALHDGVVFIETHGQRLAIEDLLADLVFHHGLKLGGSRLAMPLRLEVHVHLPKFVEAQSDLPGRLDSAAAAVHVGVDREQHEAEQQKMQQRLAQPALELGKKRLAQPRLLGRRLRLSNYGHFIHQLSPTTERQAISLSLICRGSLSLFGPWPVVQSIAFRTLIRIWS